MNWNLNRLPGAVALAAIVLSLALASLIVSGLTAAWVMKLFAVAAFVTGVCVTWDLTQKD